MTCTCHELKLNDGNRRATGAFSLNPDCVEHGYESEWYRSPVQVAKRETQDERLRELQRQAREARKRWHDEQRG